jgi:uncharacterized protein (TIGR03435 family)
VLVNDYPHDHALLLSYARSQDAEAFAQLVKRYSTLVFSTAKRVTGNAATAEDVTQDCFFTLARQATSIRGSLPSWLHRVALNRSLQVIRKQARQERSEARALPPRDAYESHWDQISPLVDAALVKLPDELREPVVQHFLLGRTQTQVAETLRINQSTVSRRLQDGIERLREHLKQTGVVCGVAALSTTLAKNASAAVPAKLSLSLAKMALAGPGPVSASASTGAVVSHGVLKASLSKAAWTVASLYSAKAAIAVALGVVLTAATVAVVHQRQPYPWQVKTSDPDILNQVSQQVRIVPTVFPPSYTQQFVCDGKHLGHGRPIDSVIAAAYHTAECRLVFKARPKPEGRYDFIANLPSGNEEALQREIERQFHWVAEDGKEKQPADVLLLTVQNRNARGWGQRAANADAGNPVDVYEGRFSDFVAFLEGILGVPVIDRTGLDGGRTIHIAWPHVDGQGPRPDTVKKAVLEELGLALVPSREMIEMLVVKEKK